MSILEQPTIRVIGGSKWASLTLQEGLLEKVSIDYSAMNIRGSCYIVADHSPNEIPRRTVIHFSFLDVGTNLEIL